MMMAPSVKFEHSPADSVADSFVSTPGTQYPSLFEPMDPTEAMTPQSFDEEALFPQDSGLEGTPAQEKKPVKKRKSWGQQLPEPKTNLPPRKRAKTEDEKEQRRVERVLRNRRAAQSSRERKRQEVEALEAEKQAIERRNHDLEMRLTEMEARYLMLQRELAQFTGSMTVLHALPTAASTTQIELRQASSPVTFSRDLFNPDQKPTATPGQLSIIETPTPQTVDPASLSPEMRPVVESAAGSSDMTQHPAVMLCDLQCQSEEQKPRTSSTLVASATITMMLYIITTSALLLNPLNQIVHSLRTGSSLSPTKSILTSIIWLVTTTASLSSSISTSTFTTTTTRSNLQLKCSLRTRLLNRLLASSPQLARPLMDATLAAMRLQYDEQQYSHDSTFVSRAGSRIRDGRADGNSPSIEVLMTLLWSVYVFEKRYRQRSGGSRGGVPGSHDLYNKLGARSIAGDVGSEQDVYFATPSVDVGSGPKSLEQWRIANDFNGHR